MNMYSQWLAACSLVALLLSTNAADGDVIASSDFRSGIDGWKLEGVGFSKSGLQSEGDAIAGLDDALNADKNWYYAAPKSFLGGDKSLAYNGWLTFDLGHYEYESMGQGPMPGYDVYLIAKNKKLTLGLRGVFKVDDNHLSQTYNVRLEESFTVDDSETSWELVNVLKPLDGKLVAKPPTQHEFISCLQSLTGIWIRGSFFRGSEATWVKNVKILQGPLNKGGVDGEVQTLVDGVLVSSSRSAPPTTTSDCCSSRTCVSNDKYELTFDRPGCMQAPDMYCCMSGSSMSDDTCSTYSASFENSKAAEIIRGTDYNEGRAFFLPTQVDRCKGEGKGQYGSKFASCTDGTAGIPATWDTGTKNQNMGLKSIPISKPFVKDYYMSSVPRICSAATLTVEVHGDLADAKDSIMVYGEDDVYLGTLFAGNLTYMKEGQRPYDPSGPGTECDGRYDPNVPGTDTNARLADPHHPSGNRPRSNGYRGGREDVVTPGVYGQEDTRCTPWASQLFGKAESTLETSESTPYKDSIAISQDRMMQYTADEQIKFTFRSVRDDSTSNEFSGTGGGGSTLFCSYGSGALDCGNTRCEGCDLDGKVIFRSIRLRFSAGVCYTKKAATDVRATFESSYHGTQPLRLLVSYSVPTGPNGAPGGDAAFSVTVGADIFSLDKYLSVYDVNMNKIGDIFRRESDHTLRSHMTGDFMVKTTSFGATDAPLPFYQSTNCDTTSPITKTDKCTKPDTQWSMSNTFINYTDTIRIPRAKVLEMTNNGVVQLYIGQDETGNAFSVGSEGGSARISPITLSYPLLHCFQKAIKRGPNFGIYLDRPMSYYFTETDFPMPAGDVSFFIVASWQKHVRYVQRRVGQALVNAGGADYAYDGVEDGLPVMRVDKDTVADMGTRWVYTNPDGEECCPASHRPAMADGEYLVSAYSNCIDNSCYDPNLDTEDDCTEDAPCATGVIAAVTDGTTFQLDTSSTAAAVAGAYTGMKLHITATLDTSALPTASAQPTGCNIGTYELYIKGGGCTGVTATWAATAANTVGTITITSGGTGCYDTTAISVTAKPSGSGNAHACTTLPVFEFSAATLLTPLAVTAFASPITILSYAEDGTVVLASALGATPSTTNNQYRIEADGISEFSLRNEMDGGTSTGSVAVRLDTSMPCETRNILTGTVVIYESGTPRLRLDTGASYANNAYDNYKIRVGTGGTSAADSPTISSYVGTVQGSVISGNSTTVFKLAAPAEQVDELYTGVMIEVDIDGDATTGDDVYSGTITAYAGTYRIVTVDTAFGKVPHAASTFTIYSRMATLSAALTAVTYASDFAANTAEAIGANGAIGATSVTLGATAAATKQLYAGMTVVLTNSDGVVQTRKISFYTAAKVAHLDSPLTDDVTTAGTTYLIYRDFEIYKDLGTSCLQNVNMRVTYTIGTAKTVSNDPGELLSIYSSWDGKTGRSTSSSHEVVKSWVLKLAGDGYYETLYPSQGVGSFTQSTLETDLTPLDKFITLNTTDGIVPNMYLKITDQTISPNEEIVFVSAKSGTLLTVLRGQLNTQAVNHTAGAIVVGPAGFNDGQGEDQMASFGGSTNRPSSTTDDAYTGLYVSIEAGTGAGQTKLINSYDGLSRTVYVTTPWSVIPDATSRYRIWWTSEIQSFDTTSYLAVVTFPRPVKQGYLYNVYWHECIADVANPVGSVGVANPKVDGLPQCKGSLGVRIPKQGEPTVYRRLGQLSTKPVAGTVTSSTSSTQFTLDDHADTNVNEYVGRKITLSDGLPAGNSANALAVQWAGTGCVLTSGYLIFSGGGGNRAAGTYTAAGGSITSARISFGGQYYTSVPTITVSDTACTNYTWNWDSLTLPTIASSSIGEVRTIMASTSGRSVVVDVAFSGVIKGLQYRIDPAKGIDQQTTISSGPVINTYSAKEVDVIRQEYPEMVAQHKEWPHGYSYMQLKAGHDGEHLGDLFLKDYTQYSTNSYYMDTLTIPKSVFENYIRKQPNDVKGEFPFTLKTPPGRSNIELHSIVIGYPVANIEDASSIEDDTEIVTSRTSSHGPPPFFPHTPAWSGADSHDRVSATHPRFRTHQYTSTCGNGMHDAGECVPQPNHISFFCCSLCIALPVHK